MQLKLLHKEAVPRALAKAERYRNLMDSSTAESICRDILAVEADNQAALVLLILTLTDQFKDPLQHTNINQPLQWLERVSDEYERHYYHGIICERWGKSQLHRGIPTGRWKAYDLLGEAMSWYEKAERLQQPGNDDSILRWNSCIRFIEANRLSPYQEPGRGEILLLE